MTVEELITILSKHPRDAEVLVRFDQFATRGCLTVNYVPPDTLGRHYVEIEENGN